MENHLETYFDDNCLDYYKNYKFIVQNLTMENIISNQLMLFPHLYVEI